MKKLAPPQEGAAPDDPAFADEDTAVMKLSPALLQALREIAPKRRRSKLPYVFALALITVVAVLARDRAARDFVAARWHHFRGGESAAAPMTAPAPSALLSSSAPPNAATPELATAIIVTRPAAPPASAPVIAAPAPTPPKADRRGAQRASESQRH